MNASPNTHRCRRAPGQSAGSEEQCCAFSLWTWIKKEGSKWWLMKMFLSSQFQKICVFLVGFGALCHFCAEACFRRRKKKCEKKKKLIISHNYEIKRWNEQAHKCCSGLEVSLASLCKQCLVKLKRLTIHNYRWLYVVLSLPWTWTTQTIATLQQMQYIHCFFGNSHWLLPSKCTAERILCRKQLRRAMNKTDLPSELPAKQTY